MPAPNTLPLSGLRIVSFEQFGAAPYATSFLAGLGAEVIKVETSQGDHARTMGPPGTVDECDSLYFQAFNLGKKSVVLDIKDPAGAASFKSLVASSDAVINNLRGTVAARLGLTYDVLKNINPRIVCGHISAYGRSNRRADRPGYDFLMQAEAGLMSLTGDPEGPPARMGVSMIDHMSGMMLAFSVTSALLSVSRGGKGCDVDVSLFDTAVHQLAYHGTWYLNAGEVTGRTPRSAHPSNTPVQLFKTSDGWLYAACMTDKFWFRLCELGGWTGLATDPRFHTNQLRLNHRTELTDLLDTLFQARTSAEWIKLLGEEIPVAPVYDLDEALENSFLLGEAEMIEDIAHPIRSQLRVLAMPIRIDGKRPSQSRAPGLGEHNEEILGPSWEPEGSVSAKGV